MRRILILTQGKTNPSDAKTATGLLRYCPDEVVGILDSTVAGQTAGELLGVGGDVPCVASLGDVRADTLLIGIAPAGGGLPPEWRSMLREAIRRGMTIVSGLHQFLGEDPELRDLASRAGVVIEDVRRPPTGLRVSTNTARLAPTFRVHTVGHDCGVGKLVVSLEVHRELERRGRRSAFVPTGQTGIMVAGGGVPIDAVVSDFVAGAIEEQVLARSDAELVVIEGQGSLVHPLYSGVTLGLLHGCAPQAMVMVCDPTRREVRHCDTPMPPLERIVEVYETMASFMTPSRVVAVALNTSRLSAGEAEREVRKAAEMTGLPAADVVRGGPGPIVDAVLREEAARSAPS